MELGGSRNPCEKKNPAKVKESQQLFHISFLWGWVGERVKLIEAERIWRKKKTSPTNHNYVYSAAATKINLTWKSIIAIRE